MFFFFRFVWLVRNSWQRQWIMLAPARDKFISPAVSKWNHFFFCSARVENKNILQLFDRSLFQRIVRAITSQHWDSSVICSWSNQTACPVTSLSNVPRLNRQWFAHKRSRRTHACRSHSFLLPRSQRESFHCVECVGVALTHWRSMAKCAPRLRNWSPPHENLSMNFLIENSKPESQNEIDKNSCECVVWRRVRGREKEEEKSESAKFHMREIYERDQWRLRHNHLIAFHIGV